MLGDPPSSPPPVYVVENETSDQPDRICRATFNVGDIPVQTRLHLDYSLIKCKRLLDW